MFQHAIVALDLDYTGKRVTDGSLRALDLARQLAARSPLRADLVHSTQPDHFVETGEHGYVVHHQGLMPGGMDSLEAQVALLAEAGIDARLRVREERPAIAITREVLESGADLVLMGKHNEKETGPRLGSVAARVLRKCPCTVWVALPDGPPTPQKMLIATDLGPVGKRALAVGARAAELFGTEVHVFHAFQLPFAEGMHNEDSYPQLMRSSKEAVREQVAEAGLKDAHIHVGCTSPARGIRKAQDELGVDLVVMGTVGRGGVPGFLLGNTAERVLPRLAGSLLVVKPEDFVSPITL